jgi:hypothetical protein
MQPVDDVMVKNALKKSDVLGDEISFKGYTRWKGGGEGFPRIIGRGCA